MTKSKRTQAGGEAKISTQGRLWTVREYDGAGNIIFSGEYASKEVAHKAWRGLWEVRR